MFLCVVFREMPNCFGVARDVVRIDLYQFFGGLKAVVRPVPIPNTAVKRSVADGSGFIDSARVGSRHSFKETETQVSAFLFPRRSARKLDCQSHRLSPSSAANRRIWPTKKNNFRKFRGSFRF